MVLKIIGIVLLCVLGIIALLLVLPFSVMLKKDGENFEISARFLFIKKNLTETLKKRSGPKDEFVYTYNEPTIAEQSLDLNIVKKEKGKETAAKSRKKTASQGFAERHNSPVVLCREGAFPPVRAVPRKPS